MSPSRVAPLALGLGLLATAASAQQFGQPEAASLFGPAAEDLASRPSNAEVMAAWPEKARAKGVGGSAVAHCLADMAGVLSDCKIMLERSHAGFGQALLSLAPRFHLRYAAEGQRPEHVDAIITASWPVFDTPPDWRTPPKPGDFSTTTTVAAWRTGEPGAAVMNCLEGRLGTLYDCMAVYQDPPGKGFGAMLLRFQGFLRLKPALIGGKPVETGVNIVMTFRPMAAGEVP
ncbi:MAG: hypothetical protein ACHP9T_12985 [Caulobacterales bacterium]